MEPCITFCKSAVKFNSVCLKRLENVDYVLFIICSSEKRLIIEPCESYERDAIRWSGKNPDKRTPKMIICHEFYRRIINHMQWNDDYHYIVFGKITTGNNGKDVIVFDLNSFYTQ
jgi:hypothetical protein